MVVQESYNFFALGDGILGFVFEIQFMKVAVCYLVFNLIPMEFHIL